MELQKEHKNQTELEFNWTNNATTQHDLNMKQWKYALKIVAKDLRANLEHTKQAHEPNYAN